MGRTPFDVFAKDLAADALSPAGRAETDVRLAPDPQFADVCFEPTAPSPPPTRELLRRLTSEGPTVLEFARQAPDALEVGTWLAKQLAWLLVRPMGAGVTFHEALEDFDALPDDDPARRLVWPHLVRLQLEVHNPHDTEPSLVSETHRIYNDWLETQQRIGMERGREEGLRPLLRLFERRLARALTGVEHAALVARLTTLGPDRLGDVVLDLDPPALAAWLADPDAR
ncbi:MAG: hypothetical protein U0324_04195 [Polyangiales bacterium]